MSRGKGRVVIVRAAGLGAAALLERAAARKAQGADLEVWRPRRASSGGLWLAVVLAIAASVASDFFFEALRAHGGAHTVASAIP